MKSLLLPLLLLFTFTLHAQSIKELQKKTNECFNERNYECAEKAMKKLIKKDKKSPSMARYYSDLGTIQRRLGKRKEALNAYNKAIKLDNCRRQTKR